MRNKRPVELRSYHWKGTNAVGRLVSGKQLALSEGEVRDRLKQQKIRIQKLTSHKISWLKTQREN